MKMQMTEYQEVNNSCMTLKTVIVVTRRNINAEPIFSMIFTVKFVLIIRTINIYKLEEGLVMHMCMHNDGTVQTGGTLP